MSFKLIKIMFFMVHKKNIILEFYLRRRTEIKAYNIFIEITESQTNKQTKKTILLSNTVCQ